MSTQHDLNRASYNVIAAQWDTARSTLLGQEQRLLDTFLAPIAAPAPILDFGCGTGRPIGEYILSRGYTLTGVDQAAEMLQLARLRYPQATWIESQMEDFHSSAPFAGIVCWDSLFHIERSLHKQLLQNLSAMLRPHGMLMLTLGGSEHPAFTDTMFGQLFFYDSHTPETAVGLLTQLGFQIVVAEFLNKPNDQGDKGRYVIMAMLA